MSLGLVAILALALDLMKLAGVPCQDRHRSAGHGHRVDDLGVGGEPLHPREGARRRGAEDAAQEVRGEERHRNALPVGRHPRRLLLHLHLRRPLRGLRLHRRAPARHEGLRRPPPHQPRRQRIHLRRQE